LTAPKLLVHREILPPGRKTAPAHSHTMKEEMFIVESGEVSVLYLDRISKQEKIEKMGPASFFGFRPEDGIRMIFNASEVEAIIWTIGTNEAEDKIIFMDEAVNFF